MDSPVLASVMSAVRAILMTAGASFVTDGLLSNDQLTTIVSGVVTLGAVVWSVAASHQKATKALENKGG